MRLLFVLAVLFTLPTAAAQFPIWTSATGTVVDAETGAPVVHATVTFLVCDAPDEPATCRPIHRNPVPPAPTDSLGRFEARSYLPRVYSVRIEHPGYGPVQLPPYDEWAIMNAYRAATPDCDATSCPTLGTNCTHPHCDWGQPRYEVALVPSPCANGEQADEAP